MASASGDKIHPGTRGTRTSFIGDGAAVAVSVETDLVDVSPRWSLV